MTKAELIERVPQATELTKRDAEQLIEIALECVIEALKRGEKVELRGFGSFRVREREARRGGNPKSGATVEILAQRVPYFQAGKQLREVINGCP